MLRTVIGRMVARILVWTMVGIAVVGGVAAAVIIFRETYQLAVDVRILNLQMEREAKDRLNSDATVQRQIDSIYRTLYSPPDGKERQISQVELWQRNRDRELRNRIQALERWRFRHEQDEEK